MKVGIVGCGMVGSSAAFAMIMEGIGREIILVDKSTARAEAEADDLFHAVPFAHNLRVKAGGYSDLANANVVVLTAGVNQKPGETRLELLTRNKAVFEDIVPHVLKYAPGAVIVVATNPVDVMTHLTAQIAARSGVPSQRIVGSGTMLDTARFRTLLGEALGVDSHHVHAYVIGEHGDSEVLTWSLATVAGLHLDEICHGLGICLHDNHKQQIDERVRGAAYRIIQGKGSTYYGIGSALARLVKTILHDHRAILTVCSREPRVEGVDDVTLALPRIVGGSGVHATIPLHLSADEHQHLGKSARILKDAISSLGS